MIVTVHDVEPQSGSTVWTATGRAENGDEITFGGDWRAMEGLALLVEDMGEVEAEIETWQVLSVEPAPHPAGCTCLDCATDKHPPSNAR